MLSAEDILKPSKLKAVRVAVPEWGGEVYVAQLRADERDQLESDWLEARTGESMVGFRAFITAGCLCDAERTFLFPEPAKVFKQLGRKDATGVNRVFTKACELNGFTKEDQEELLKNSEAAPSESGSGE
jgi:hypothetical protein